MARSFKCLHSVLLVCICIRTAVISCPCLAGWPGQRPLQRLGHYGLHLAKLPVRAGWQHSSLISAVNIHCQLLTPIPLLLSGADIAMSWASCWTMSLLVIVSVINWTRKTVMTPELLALSHSLRILHQVTTLTSSRELKRTWKSGLQAPMETQTIQTSDWFRGRYFYWKGHLTLAYCYC